MSPSDARIVSVAPSSRASSSFTGSMSIATMRLAAAIAAPCTMFRPTPPQPTTATVSPGRTFAVLSTAPTPVMTAQPISASSISGRSSSTLIAVCAGTTAISANEDVV